MRLRHVIIIGNKTNPNTFWLVNTISPTACWTNCPEELVCHNACVCQPSCNVCVCVCVCVDADFPCMPRRSSLCCVYWLHPAMQRQHSYKMISFSRAESPRSLFLGKSSLENLLLHLVPRPTFMLRTFLCLNFSSFSKYSPREEGKREDRVGSLIRRRKKTFFESGQSFFWPLCRVCLFSLELLHPKSWRET